MSDADTHDLIPEDDVSEQAREMIAELVELGLDAPDAIVERVCDVEGLADAEWTRDEIAQCVEAKRLVEATWPATLDTDRLDRAFAELRGRGVLCLHDAGFTQSDASGDAHEAWEEAGGATSGLDGWCAYTRQDAERAAAGGGLLLAFGSFTAKDQDVRVARRIEHRLQVAGFEVEWDGDPARRIQLLRFDFRRRGVPAG